MNGIEYIAYIRVEGEDKPIEIGVEAMTPEEALNILENHMQLRDKKVEDIRLAYKASGFFVKDFS